MKHTSRHLRYVEVLIHVIGWGIVFGFPLLMMNRSGFNITWGEYLSHGCVVPLSFLVVFYVNYLLLIPRLLFTGRTRQYILYKTPQRMEIERILTNSFHYTCGGRILGCFFSYADMVRIHTNDAELEGLNVIVEQVEGVEIGIVVRETAPNHCRVSVRTGSAYDAAAICAYLGGGGHTHAAGCELEGRPADVLTQVEAVCAQQMAAA